MKKVKKIEINKIYWITHPSFYLTWSNKTYSKQDIEKFFQKRLFPLIEQAKKENSVIVFVSSPLYYIQNNDCFINFKKTKNKEITEIEKKFRKKLEEELGEKAIITETKEHIFSGGSVDLTPEEIIEEIKTQLKKKKFKINSKTTVYGFGSDWRECSKYYPQLFRKKTKIRGTFHVPVWGSLMNKKTNSDKESINTALKKRKLSSICRDIPKTQVYSPELLSLAYKAHLNRQKSKKPPALKHR
jgi:hypothetical protein